jgi:hypothetical protein
MAARKTNDVYVFREGEFNLLHNYPHETRFTNFSYTSVKKQLNQATGNKCRRIDVCAVTSLKTDFKNAEG